METGLSVEQSFRPGRFDSGRLHQIGRVVKLAKALRLDRRDFAGSSPASPTIIGASFNGRTLGFDPGDAGSIPAALAIMEGVRMDEDAPR